MPFLAQQHNCAMMIPSLLTMCVCTYNRRALTKQNHRNLGWHRPTCQVGTLLPAFCLTRFYVSIKIKYHPLHTPTPTPTHRHTHASTLTLTHCTSKVHHSGPHPPCNPCPPATTPRGLCLFSTFPHLPGGGGTSQRACPSGPPLPASHASRTNYGWISPTLVRFWL